MRIAIISFSRAGYLLSESLCELLNVEQHYVRSYTKSMYTKKIMDESQLDSEDRSIRNVEQFAKPVDVSIKEWTGERFEDSDAIIFVGACGIAVRSIAPFLKGTNVDPAVVVVDEQGKFAISLLSGHVGGANELTEEIGRIIGGTAVITTAKDTSEKFAVDVFARKNNCFTSDLELAKEISAAIVNGEKIGFLSDFPWIGEVPAGLVVADDDVEAPEKGIYVTNSYEQHPFTHTLYLIPRVITVGVECNAGTPGQVVEKIIRKACDEKLIPSVSMERVASIDRMKEEEGIINYCQERNLPFVTYSQEELDATEGTFAESKQRCNLSGIISSSERSAILGSEQDGVKSSLIIRNFSEEGVCVSLARKKWSVHF